MFPERAQPNDGPSGRRPSCSPLSDIEKPTETTSITTDIVYPEGGRQAWLVVFGAWCGLAASIGLYNTTGVFQAYISNNILTAEPQTNIGWIFGIYAFITWFCGVQVGPTFDAKGPRGLLIAGSICTLGGIFALSACTAYHEFILSFSILSALGSSLLITPSIGSVSHWFCKRRGLASGIAFTGSGFGGVIFPLMIQSLLPKIGWAWSIRVLGLILSVLCCCCIAFCRSRLPPRKGLQTTWGDTLPDPKIFVDGTGAMAVTTAAIVFVDLAYFIPVAYVPGYYLERQGIDAHASLAGEAAFAFQLLAILNAASILGRWVAGDVADRFGRYNTMAVSLGLCLTSVLCLWLPDCLIDGLPNSGLLVAFVVLFGFASGSNVSLTPICLGQLCDTREYGRYYASCYTMVAFGTLASIPVAGALVEATHVSGKQAYWAAITFTGLCYLIALACFVWVRIRMRGWNWRVKW